MNTRMMIMVMTIMMIIVIMMMIKLRFDTYYCKRL